MIYMEFVCYHWYLLMFSNFEGLGTALHPRYTCVTSALQIRYKCGGISMMYMEFIGYWFHLISRAWALRYIRVTHALHPRYKCVTTLVEFQWFIWIALVFVDMFWFSSIAKASALRCIRVTNALHPRYNCVTHLVEFQ